MKYSPLNIVLGLAILAIGVVLGLSLLSFGQADDAPPVGMAGILVIIGAAVMGVRIALRRHRPPSS